MTPRKSEKIFPKNYAHELLRIAEADLQSGCILSQHLGRRENTVYHAQQAFEKALKAVLCWKKIPVPLVHDAGIFVAKLSTQRLLNRVAAKIDWPINCLVIDETQYIKKSLEGGVYILLQLKKASACT